MIAMLFSICLIHQTKAQDIPRDISERINNSTYIFEGHIIRTNSYWTQDSTYIYTSSTIEIYKIFKGNIDCGTVEVITEGGQVGDKSLSISHNLILKKGMKGIFLTNTTQHELPSTDFYPETDTNKLDIPYGLQGYIKYFEDGINHTVVDQQFNLDSIAQVYNLMSFYTQLNYVDCGIGPVMKVREHKLKLQERPLPLIQHNPKENLIQITPLKVKEKITPTALTGTLTYTVMNPHVINTYPRKFEFDIAIGDDVPSGYFEIAYILLEYDTSVFDDSIIQHHNFQATNIGFAADTNSYSPTIPFESPNFANEIILPLPGLLNSNSQLVNISNSPNPAIHVVMTFKNCDNPSSIQLGDPNTFAPGAQEWTDSIHGNSLQYFPYTNYNFSSSVTVPSCALAIDTIIPFKVNGGVGDTVSVGGFKFGTSRGNGNIFLPNADDGGQTWLALDSTDYLPNGWTDSLVRFIVPGVSDSNNIYNPTNKYGVAGSGIVKIKNNQGDSAAYNTMPLTIFYSISSRTQNISGLKKFPDDLLGYNFAPTIGGYTFRVDTSFSNYQDRAGCLRAAAHDWQCLSHTTMVLGDTIQSSNPRGANDDFNVIEFGTDPSPTALARTYIWAAFAAGACQREFVTNIDIVINRNSLSDLFIDSIQCDSLPYLKYDLYAILLHEMGHAHILNHINDTNRIMWYKAHKGDTIYTVSGLRKVYLLYDLSCKEGANYVLTRATDITINATCGAYVLMLPLTVTDCDTNIIAHRSSTFGCVPTVGLDEIKPQNINLSCYPNPTNSKVNIEYVLDYESDVTINIFDNFGRQIQNIIKLKDSWGKHTNQINTSKFATGIYFVQILINEKPYSTKFIKE